MPWISWASCSCVPVQDIVLPLGGVEAGKWPFGYDSTATPPPP